MFKEEYAIILDYLPSGYASNFHKEPVAQAVGEDFYTLLELTPRPDAKISLRDRVYIGKEKRDVVQFIKGRLEYERLTATARNELQEIVAEKVKKDEAKYVDFFNRAGAITIRQHSLELLPGIGKKHMLDILDQREKEAFKSFDDIAKRINLMPDPRRVIVDRIMDELQGKSKYYLFVKSVRPPMPGSEGHGP